MGDTLFNNESTNLFSDEYSSSNEQKFFKIDYHWIEDYIRYYLFTSQQRIPYSYVYFFASIMNRRIMNAKCSTIQSLDSRHAKAIMLSLMAIVIYTSQNQKYINSDEYIYLLKIFYIYSCYVRDFLEKNKQNFSKQVHRSLSIFSKLKSQNQNQNLNQNLQYQYCMNWLEKLTQHEHQNINKLVDDIRKNYDDISFMEKDHQKCASSLHNFMEEKIKCDSMIPISAFFE